MINVFGNRETIIITGHNKVRHVCSLQSSVENFLFVFREDL